MMWSGARRPPARPPDDIEDIDPGLAGERTELAWTRTAISFAAVGGALLKYRPAAGFVVLALSAVVWRLGRLPAGGTGRARGRRLVLITVAILGISLAALVVSFAGHPSGGLR
jgi:uncharacterized membrane protein YidH (DUF202 family)